MARVLRLFAGTAYFVVRYRIRAHVRLEVMVSLKMVQGREIAHLKLRPQLG